MTTAISFSADGRFFAAIATDWTVRLWDTDSLVEFQRLEGHRRPVTRVVVSADGRRVATASESEAVVRVWDASTGKLLLRASGNDVDINADGEHVIVSSEQGGSRCIATKDGRELFSVAGHQARFSPDGSALLTRSAESVALWDARSGQNKFSKSVQNCTNANLSADGRLVLCDSGNSVVALDARIGASRGRVTLPTTYNYVVSPAGDLVAAVSLFDVTARIIRLKDGQPVRRLVGHYEPLSAVAFSRDGQMLATSSDDTSIRVWSLSDGAEIARFEYFGGGIRQIAFSPKGDWVAGIGFDDLIQIWRLSDGKVIFGTSKVYPVAVAAVPEGGERIATTSLVTTCVWDARDAVALTEEMKARGGKQPRLLDHATALEAYSRAARVLHSKNSIVDVSVSPDSLRVVSAGWSGTCTIWDASSGNDIRQLSGHDGDVYSARFSPDGKIIATVGADDTVRLWDTETGAETQRYTVLSEATTSLAFSPDGAQISVGSRDGTISVFAVSSGVDLARLAGHTDAVREASFSPDGQQVLSASRDGTARIWDLASGKETLRLSGHSGAVTSARFSRDQSRIVTASSDRTARIWNPVTGEQLIVLAGHEEWVCGATFNDDGTLVVTASEDRTARIWDAASGEDLSNKRESAEESPNEWARLRPVRYAIHQGRIRNAVFVPNSEWILTISDDETVVLWDYAGKNIARLSTIIWHHFSSAPRLRPQIEPFGRNASPAATAQPGELSAGTVNAMAFAPKRLRAGEYDLVQVIVHASHLAEEAKRRAQAADKSTTAASAPEELGEVSKGSSITISLSATNAVVQDPPLTQRWTGTLSNFSFRVCANGQSKSVALSAEIAVDGTPMARMQFKRDVAKTVSASDLIAGLVTTKLSRFKRVFFSYSSVDRAKVIEEAKRYEKLGIRFFHDVLSMDPGERWEKKLYLEIDRCDLFLLFWSSHAKASPWVMKEAERAWQRQARNGGKRPHLRPKLIEEPPPLPDQQWLKEFHFNDPELVRKNA